MCVLSSVCQSKAFPVLYMSKQLMDVRGMLMFAPGGSSLHETKFGKAECRDAVHATIFNIT